MATMDPTLTHVFESPYDQYAGRNGEGCVVIGTRNSATHPGQYDEEVGNLYRIEFADGQRIDAWPEELTPNPAE